MPFNKEEAWREEQAERIAIEIHLRRNGETLQSIQRNISKAPPPITSVPGPLMPKAPPPIS